MVYWVNALQSYWDGFKSNPIGAWSDLEIQTRYEVPGNLWIVTRIKKSSD